MKKPLSKKLLFLPLIVGILIIGFFIWKRDEEVVKEEKPKQVVQPSIYEEQGLQFASKIEGKDFYIYSDDKWEKTFLKGVNIGAAKPGTFPGELAITKEEYLRWFEQIHEMNANVIRVYTTQNPAFYDALYEFNQYQEEPLYLMQGVWLDEEAIANLKDAYAEEGKIKEEFIRDAKDLVDIFHGNATLPERSGFASGVYDKDISPYVIGWVLGIEWDPEFVQGTNDNNPDKTEYKGTYLTTENASPFEVFLAEVGDEILEYEATKYKTTRALSFTNWVTTDMLSHPNEPFHEEDMAVVNTEHIKTTESFPSGMFASYHIYPYYPDFLSYQPEYVEFKDENDQINTYQAYLRDLKKEHSVPVMVTEFGIPASRGKAHEAVHSGFDQGHHDEREQGEMLASLLQDIHEEGYSGALIFSWQDEWFKRTWNTMDFDLADRRPYWSNPQTNEQQFGLLAFDPGEKESVSYVDGDVSEWEKDKPIHQSDDADLYMKSDEKYVYFMVETKDFDFQQDKLLIPVDTLSGQGNMEDSLRNISFDRAADFLIEINGEDNSRIVVDAYYDSFYYLYGEKLNMIEKQPAYVQKDSGIFNPMYLTLTRELYLPQEQRTIPFSKYETGVLKHGDANPKHEDFNSLTDFAYKDDHIEIRIPWQLLNVMDPSTKAVMDDFYKNQAFTPVNVEEIYAGVEVVKNGTTEKQEIGLSPYTWDPWDQPTYHERLKPSYEIMKKAFAEIE